MLGNPIIRYCHRTGVLLRVFELGSFLRTEMDCLIVLPSG